MSFLKNLFGKKPNEENQQNIENIYTQPDKEKDGYINVGKNIFPVIRASGDPIFIVAQRNDNELITDEIAEGLIVAYVLDLANNHEYISKKHLERFLLTHEELKVISLRNLITKIGSTVNIGKLDFSDRNPNFKPFFRAIADKSLEPSLMLIDEFWKQAEQIVNSTLVAISLPAKNILLFSDMKLMESFRTMRPIAEQQYEKSKPDNTHLTNNTYIRKNGKWVLFLDTEQQMAELWS
jgi:uncharacterized protein YtpQ (UPF0354 family)